MQHRVVTILSSNYAGSHFLSLLIGSHTRAEHIGEIKHLRKPHSWRMRQYCKICDDQGKCPLQRSIDPERLDNIYQQIFANFGGETSLLVDASKKWSWAARFADDKRIGHHYIHLLRDPRALVRRWEKTYGEQKKHLDQRWKVLGRSRQQALPLLFARRHRIYLEKWLQQNREISHFLQGKNLNYRVMSYRDLARDPARELTPVMAWLGFDFEPAQIEYWRQPHHGSRKYQYDWVEKQQVTGHFDLRWKRELPTATAESIAGNPRLQDYLSKQGLRLADDGLTRHGV
ncbi:hypothetical protein [Alkalilimnicola sp. S0819]|uniref:hypothetical protein n=1 Tax=Alkalilimnicola sp. S0819 TaxID=2613922 RepID=UPI0012625584|nr:hypothetical protein [Alkalilimnicola sp. S0819]KAB7627335.1 hypothetical protein F3N43_05325 [Alkalilimnicola sp. S0819]MPQ16051.1 hypothetical protein [Alkalilimnicola sp. S0819]